MPWQYILSRKFCAFNRRYFERFKAMPFISILQSFIAIQYRFIDMFSFYMPIRDSLYRYYNTDMRYPGGMVQVGLLQHYIMRNGVNLPSALLRFPKPFCPVQHRFHQRGGCINASAFIQVAVLHNMQNYYAPFSLCILYNIRCAFRIPTVRERRLLRIVESIPKRVPAQISSFLHLF